MSENVPAATESARRGTLSGDRPCIRCGYNLFGQSIVREPHYDMLIVQCPECGTPASLQEHPLLGRWAGRWAGVLAAVSLLWVVALWFATAGTIFGVGSALSWSCINAAEDFISGQQMVWAQQQGLNVDNNAARAQVSATAAAGSPPPPPPINYQYQVDPKWRTANTDADLFAQWGGWGAIFDCLDYDDWAAFAAFAIVIFVLSSAVASSLLWVKRRFLALAAIPVMVVVSVLWILFGDVTGFRFGSSLYEVAADVVGVRVCIAVSCLLGAALIAGLLLGRPLVRLMIRLMLPPRLRCPLSLLWTCDGLEPPLPSFFSRRKRQPII